MLDDRPGARPEGGARPHDAVPASGRDVIEVNGAAEARGKPDDAPTPEADRRASDAAGQEGG